VKIYPGTADRMMLAAARGQIHKLPLTHYLDVAAFVAVMVIGIGLALVVVFLKGLNHHTVMRSMPRPQLQAPPPAPWRPSLPEPMTNWHDPSRDKPFTGESYWPAEPEPIAVTPEPEPDPDATVCEGPSCSVIVAPVNAWVCGPADEDQENQEDHYFCGKNCMNDWMRADRARRAARPHATIGGQIRKWWD
jgi:hypothetical protein